MTRVLTVLYEDQLAGSEPARFGPHVLLMACVEDETGIPRETLGKRIHLVPKKGDGRLRKALEQDGGRLWPALALFDDDKCRRVFRLPFQACKSQVHDAATALAANIPIVLLDRNIETLVARACQAMQESEPVSKPTQLERDLVLTRMAREGAPVRTTLRTALPSFDRLVGIVVWQVRTHWRDLGLPRPDGM